jgi:hypothetical protein
MGFSFAIPMWVFWIIGIPLGLVILFCAWIGIMFLWAFGKEVYFGEILGKHSEVSGTLEEGEIKKLDLDSEVEFLDSKNKRKKSTKQSGEIRIIGVDIAVMGGQQ